MKLSPRNKLLLVIGIAVLVVVVLAAALIPGQLSRLAQTRLDIEDAVSRSDAANALLEQRQQIRNQAAVTDAALLQLGVAVPENPELPTLIIDLQDAAREAGVVVMSMTPADPVTTEGETYIGIPVKVEVWGTWADTVDYLQRLARLERELRTKGYVVEVLPEPEGDTESPAELTYPPYYQTRTQIDVIAYVIPPSQPAPSADATPAAE